MGQRANLIVASGESYELYYTHWRANTLDSDLFWGPDAAIEFVRSQRTQVEGAEWLDNVWAEGGAVIDPSRRRLVWFGGEDIVHDVPLRRVHLDLMRELWPGWTIEWAVEGIADMARCVGQPLEPLLVRKYEREEHSIELVDPEEPDWIRCILSSRSADDQWKVHATDGYLDEIALSGPRLVDAFVAADLPDRYDYAARTNTFPTGGLHIDAREKRVELWCAAPEEELERRFADAWPGWSARWHRDRFEAHEEILGDRIVLPRASEEELVAAVRSIALRATRDSSNLAVELGQRLATDSGEAWINPLATRDDPPRSLGADAERVFDAAVARWRSHRA
jgi:hypothetical protein